MQTSASTKAFDDLFPPGNPDFYLLSAVSLSDEKVERIDEILKSRGGHLEDNLNRHSFLLHKQNVPLGWERRVIKKLGLRVIQAGIPAWPPSGPPSRKHGA